MIKGSNPRATLDGVKGFRTEESRHWKSILRMALGDEVSEKGRRACAESSSIVIEEVQKRQ